MRTIAGILLAIFAIAVIYIGFSGCDDAVQTAHDQFAPSALLKKYEYFKNLSAAIDEKRADIEMYQTEIEGMEVTDKDTRFYKEQRKSELLGIISIHNNLCKEYNAAMSKFNYRFTNAGDLPETNLTPLPREMKPYMNQLNKK